MQPFDWSLPTQMKFGPGRVNELGAIAKQFGTKAMVVTFEPIPAAQWIVDKVLANLKEAGIETVLYDKVEPNPSVKTCDAGTALFKKTGCEFAIAIGGGSVIDAAKYISSVAYSGGSAWDYVVLNTRQPKEYTGAYPIIAVPTVSAAGSEVNAGGVITNTETKMKSFSRSPYRVPKVAIIDPELIATVPLNMTGDGGVDIFCHLVEHYLSSGAESEIADRLTEGMILALKEYLARVLKDPKDIEARGQIAVCAALGWSGLQALGRLGTIPIHFIEHQLSAYYPISHGRGMTIILPAYLDHFADALPQRWAKLARRVFDVREADDAKAAKMLAPAVVEWLRSIGMYTTLADVNVDGSDFVAMTDDIFEMYAGADGNVPGARPMTRDDVMTVFRKSLGQAKAAAE